jgi:hypothetical protein
MGINLRDANRRESYSVALIPGYRFFITPVSPQPMPMPRLPPHMTTLSPVGSISTEPGPASILRRPARFRQPHARS